MPKIGLANSNSFLSTSHQKRSKKIDDAIYFLAKIDDFLFGYANNHDNR